MRRRRPQRGALAERLASVTAIWGGVRARGAETFLKCSRGAAGRPTHTRLPPLPLFGLAGSLAAAWIPPEPLPSMLSATPIASRRRIFGLRKPFWEQPVDAYVCSGRFRPNASLLYEHMFSSVPHLLRAALDTTVALLTLEDGEEVRREAEWEGRCPGAYRSESGRRLSAPAASSAGFSVAQGSQQAARGSRSTCSARSRCRAARSAATAR